MKVLLLNIDSKLPNIALHKIAMWHEQQGDEIVWDMPMMLGQTDKAYASCILTKNASVVANYKGLYPELITGGTGYDLLVKLPPEIEDMKPKINIGFTTRGCNRDCPFCLVVPSEGSFRITGDIYYFYDGENGWVICLDNNVLYDVDHFERMCHQCRHEGIAVDWNQGLDIRFVTPRVCEILNNTKLKCGVRFAFDFPELEPIVREKVALLRQYYKRKYIFFYVLVGFNTTLEQDLHRLNVLRELGCRAYVMRHENTPKERIYNELASWVNNMWSFAKWDFDEYLHARGVKPLTLQYKGER